MVQLRWSLKQENLYAQIYTHLHASKKDYRSNVQRKASRTVDKQNSFWPSCSASILW